MVLTISIDEAKEKFLRIKERIALLSSLGDPDQEQRFRDKLKQELVTLISEVTPLTRTGFEEDQAIAISLVQSAHELLKRL